MLGQRSWWKGNWPDRAWSRSYWKKYRSLVEPLLHFIPYGAAGKHKAEAVDAALMGQFQSLGDNCEFGLVQGQLGAHPLGFYRFAHTTIDGLIAAFESRFIALQSPENIVVKYREFPNGEFEYVTSVLQYQFYSHTGYQSDTLSADEVQNKEMKRLKFLARTMIEDAESGKKIFVYKSNVLSAERRIENLHDAIGRCGLTWLLWVTPATADWPAGRVEQVSERLLRGSIERFAPYANAGDFSLEGWRTICRNAYDLWVARRSARA